MERSTQLSNTSIVNETTDMSRCREFNASARLFFLVAYSLVFAVGLLLNGFILRFYFTRRQTLSKTLMIYLKNLTAADFILSLSLLFYIINSTTSSMTIRQAYCNFGSKVFYLNMYASMLFMAHIAYNRYLSVVHPLKAHSKTHILLTVRAAYIITTITWVFLIILLIAAFFTVSVNMKKNTASVPISCEGFRSSVASIPVKVTSTCLVAFFLSILIFLICVYYRICRKLAEVQQNQQVSSDSTKFAKASKKMMVLIIVFCVCFIPFHLVNLPYVFLGCHWSHVLHFLKDLTRVFTAFNVCLDPLIYVIFCKELSEQLKLFFVRKDTPTPSRVTEISLQ
uniref:G-protein coupled receptors family 1 profile domain-containing protein n=2 Tax=Sphaeramia orbicularis TaxID=375764 RepID=A0A672YXW2_9TELE